MLSASAGSGVMLNQGSVIADCLVKRNNLFVALEELRKVSWTDSVFDPDISQACYSTDLSLVGSTKTSLGHAIFPGNCGQFWQHTGEVMRRIESQFKTPAPRMFKENWVDQRGAFEETLERFFGPFRLSREPAYFAVREGRVCYANAIEKTFGCTMDASQITLRPVNQFRCFESFPIYLQSEYLHLELPLSRIRFASKSEPGGVAAVTSPFLHRQTMDRKGYLGDLRLRTEHTSFGCCDQVVPDPEHREFLESQLDTAVFDHDGPDKRLLYVDNYDIDLCRYVPLGNRDRIYDCVVQKINWNLDKETGLTTGISVCFGLEPLSHVMIPNLVEHLTAAVKQL